MRMSEEQHAAYLKRQQQQVTPEERQAVTKAFRLADPACPLEDDEQAALARYLNLLEHKHGFRWCHVPNGGDRDIRVAARLKSHGVKKGVPDVLIFGAPPLHPTAAGVAIELKRRHGGVVSDEQKIWLAHLEANGWLCTVAKGWEQAMKWLNGMGWK